MRPLVEIDGLKKYFLTRKTLFRRKKEYLKAVDGVSFDILEGETLALVGESGCGKTTTGKVILRLIEPTAGQVRFMGHNIFDLPKQEMRRIRLQMQLIFQDVTASLNPRKTISQILSLPYMRTDFHKNEVRSKVLDSLAAVSLTPTRLFADRYPHELSGGQRQRVVIARAIALSPKFVVADEPVAALDMSIRAQILGLMKELKDQFRLTYLYITHDLSIVRSIADRVVVMYLGEIVESSHTKEIFNNPLHPYTKALLSATPIPDPRKALTRKRIILKGDLPSPVDPPRGCRFHTRCPSKRPRCGEVKPELIEVEKGHSSRCHLCLA